MNLVVGCRGMVGSALMRAFEKVGEPVDGFSFSLENPLIYANYKASRIFFCASPTDVDSYERSSDVVLYATINTIKAMMQVMGANPDAHLVFFSSGYVFGESERPWQIYGDAKNPVNTYGMCKMLVEKWVLANGGSVVRTLGVFGQDYRRKNFVDRILDSVPDSLFPVSRPDYVQNWTHSDYLADVIVSDSMWHNQAYHIAGEPLSRWEMATGVCNRLESLGRPHPQLVRSKIKLDDEAPRPAVCILATKYGSVDTMLENYIK